MESPIQVDNHSDDREHEILTDHKTEIKLKFQ